MRTLWLILIYFFSAMLKAQPDTLLDFMDPFIGDWLTTEPMNTTPDAGNHPDVGFRFEWLDDDHRVLKFYEGIPSGDLRLRILDAVVAPNPRSGVAEFFGYQLRDDFLFKGHFYPDLEHQGFVRRYDVYYPPNTRFRSARDSLIGMKSYRDLCKLVQEDTLVCKVQQFHDGRWKPWGSGEPFSMVRKQKYTKSAEQQMTAFEGLWQSTIDPKYRDHPMIKKFNPELKPQLLSISKISDGKWQLQIFDVDRPGVTDTTLLVSGWILVDENPDLLHMLEYNLSTKNCHHGSYRFFNHVLQRNFNRCAKNEMGVYREEWHKIGPTQFTWLTYFAPDGREFTKSGIDVKWNRVEEY